MKSSTMHRQILFGALAVAAFVALMPRPSSAILATLTDDSYVTDASTSLHGTKPTLKVQDSTTHDSSTYLKFDLSTLPAGVTAADVDKATLTVFVTKVSGTGPVSVYEAASTPAWTESSINASNTPAVEGAALQTSTPSSKFEYLALDVTGAVLDWVTTPANNNGLILNPGTGANLLFDSKESKSTSQAPTLQITLKNAVTSANIVDGTITAADIAPNSITIDETDFSPGAFNVRVGPLTLISNIDGTANTALGWGALSSNDHGGGNSAVGDGALASNTGGSGNTALGEDALASATMASGNVAVGIGALTSVVTGAHNTAVGAGALGSTLGVDNTAVGYTALFSDTTGNYNTAVGKDAMLNTTGGSLNVALGQRALLSNTTGAGNTVVGNSTADALTSGDNNTGVGSDAFDLLTTGTNNTAIGWRAGASITTGSDNIYIGNAGANESQTIRIGFAQTNAYVQGIFGATSTVGSPVFVNSSGKLGTTTSSRRFKTDIRDIGDISRKLLKLRPVSFRYKKEIDPDGTLQYGLIAEEVAKVMPDLVLNGDDGKPYTVKYHLLAALLLNEVQKQHQTLQAQETALQDVRAENAALRAGLGEIDGLKARLTALEGGSGRPNAVTCSEDRGM